jgi:hypothetical protein
MQGSSSLAVLLELVLQDLEAGQAVSRVRCAHLEFHRRAYANGNQSWSGCSPPGDAEAGAEIGERACNNYEFGRNAGNAALLHEAKPIFQPGPSDMKAVMIQNNENTANATGLTR